ncbi:RNA 2',3'-cyclic phosphodiesterase [Photobacterium lipolyticum]|uniref:RNA 2',3'-cyclic phosphodiesterase n=1 Tax=Photobacterium lipolyticum TaxID=266810 RepID=A0A2T3MXP4_9GAMM|nr:RNA 2',3'-cyclic phosphodiesterase [Photobacterium lipolyticum]PSW04650.1 RNA 2',3'-cyclic phosphodiesterase [Photobacterium lipolyticum]
MSDITERLFFALDLHHNGTNQSSFRQLCQLKQDLLCDGRDVPERNLHITLAFLGSVTAKQKQALINYTGKLTTIPAFSVSYSQLNYRKRNKIIWLDSDNPPFPLLTLASELKQAAIKAGLQQEDRPYRPHITLKKQVRRPPQSLPASPDLHFDFRHFGLYISEAIQTPHGSGVRYRCLQQWPLSQPDKESK